MILSSPRALRSLWSVAIAVTGLVFVLVGVATAVPSDDIDQSVDPASLVIGVAVSALGIAVVWRGLRMGGTPHGDGLVVREMLGSTFYRGDQIAAFGVAEEDHTVPLKILYPSIRLTNGEQVRVTALATYRVLPGARRQAVAAAQQMAKWMGKPVTCRSQRPSCANVSQARRSMPRAARQ